MLGQKLKQHFYLWLFPLLGLVWWAPVLFSSEMYLGSGTDLVAYQIPYRTLAFSQDSWPLWNPYVFSGLPFHSTGFQSLAHPASWLSMLVPAFLEIKLTVWLCLFCSGLSMFILLRSRNCSPIAASFGGLWYGFGAATIARLYAGHLDILLELPHWPLLAWAVLRCFEGQERSPQRIVVAGLVLGLSILTGHYHFVYLSVLWTILMSLGETSWPRWFTSWMAIGALGFAISAVYWAPLPGLLSLASRGVADHQAASAAGAPVWSAFSWLTPHLFEAQTGEAIWWSFSSWEGQFYLGLPVLGLACFGALAQFPERRRLLGSILFFSLLACGSSTPLFQLLYELDPLLQKFRAPSRFAWFVNLALIWLAAKGLDRLRESNSRRLCAGCIAAFVVLSTLFCFLAGSFIPGLPGPLAETLWSRSLPSLLIGVLSVAAVFLVPRRFLMGALFLLCLVDLRLLAQPWLGTVPAHSLQLPPALVKRVSENPLARIQFDSGLNLHNRGMLYQLSQSGGYDRLVDRRYMEAAFAALGLESGPATLLSNYTQGPFWQLQGVRYSLSPSGPPGPQSVEIASDSGLTLYENKQALDRAYLVYQVEASEDDKTTRLALAKGELSAREQVYVNKLDFEKILTHLGSQEAEPQGRISYFQLHSNAVFLGYETQTPAILVLTDAAYPGWTARVDGAEVPWLRANGGLHRAVAVPAGAHQVEFSYWPPGRTLGLSISGSTLLLLLGWALVFRFKSKPS